VSSRPPTKHEGPFSPSSESGLGPVARAGRPLAQPPFEPKPGIVVAGKYRVERVIGEGGMGVVVAATHVELDQHVAIKFLLPEAMRHGAVVERFLREAKVAAKVKSEHVARVTDVGKVEPSGVPFIVMEYLEGSDLGALIDASGRLPLDEACEIGLQACEALAEVHAAGIVHRDLKPSNLFVTRRSDGSPCLKLLDFGISKLAVGPTTTAPTPGSPRRRPSWGPHRICRPSSCGPPRRSTGAPTSGGSAPCCTRPSPASPPSAARPSPRCAS
jgi:serine/threonine protein kinase